MTDAEKQFLEGYVRCILDITRDALVFIENVMHITPEIVECIQTLKASGMTEDEIVQKIMSQVKEAQ